MPERPLFPNSPVPAGAVDPDAPLTESLRSWFGFTSFRPHQEEIIRAILAGRDMVGVLPTGAGKSLTFQLPALLLPGVVLVISPLIALMEDQVHQLVEAGIDAAACINGRTPGGEAQEIMAGARRGDIKLLYVAPERLTTPHFQRQLSELPISRLVVDEAHCVSEWGHNFRPDYRRIRDFRALRPDTPIAALTATATPVVRTDMIANLGLQQPVEVIGDFDRANLFWQVRRVRRGLRVADVARLLEKDLGNGTAIVYAPSRVAVEKLAAGLAEHGFAAACYHAGLPGELRARNQNDFMTGKLQVMCATVAFGMGVHKNDVRHVVHHGVPRSLEAYYQEAGRAGRDGESAVCTLLYSPADLQFHQGRIDESYPARGFLRTLQLAAVRGGLRELADERSDRQAGFALGLSALLETGYLKGNAVDGYQVGRGGDRGERAMRWLARHRDNELARLFYVRDYAETTTCRSTILLRYFGQALQGCGHCDGCVGGRSRRSKPKEALVMSALQQERFEQLRRWRQDLAGEWRVPAFHIMNDRTLRDVAALLPADREAFIGIKGLGEKKWEAFGYDLMQFLQERLHQ